MKAFYFLIPILMVAGCKTQTGTKASSDSIKLTAMQEKPSCPEEGTCNVIVHNNKTFKMSEDGTGAMYPDIQEGKGIVIEYTYFREGPEGTADGNYTENIYFEIPAGTETLVKKDVGLADVKMIYGKHAYRNSNYYPVTNGSLSILKKGKTIVLNLDFKIKETSQEVSRINQTVAVE